jgi:hypothetical protein
MEHGWEGGRRVGGREGGRKDGKKGDVPPKKRSRIALGGVALGFRLIYLMCSTLQ